jgi:riboflavin kinase / FMN adenylyltransferase
VRVCRSLKALASAPPPKSVVAVGTFDGVHLGHAAVLGEVVRWARKLRAVPAAIVFLRPPRGSLPQGAPLDLVTSPEHRLQLIGRLGIELALELEFGQGLARLPAGEFAELYLAGGLRAAGLVMGHDARLGRGGAGNFAAMRKIGPPLGMEVRRTAAVRVRGQVVSSSAVRRAIVDGRMDLAERLLGRRVSVLGTVVAGRGHGRQLGFPTVNLDIDREVRPPMGVYATLAHVDGGPALRSACNVGFRPTATRSQQASGRRRDLLVEAHLLEGGADLYGRTVELEFVRKLREERRFESDEELAGQIARDVAEARAAFSAPRPRAPGARSRGRAGAPRLSGKLGGGRQ